jgi:hypothetical protein
MSNTIISPHENLKSSVSTDTLCANVSLFNTLLCKILYPNNTEKEMNDIFKPCKPIDFCSNPQDKSNSIYKNPKYTNIIFIIVNNFLFYNNHMTDSHKNTDLSKSIFGKSHDNNDINESSNIPQNIYSVVSRKYQFLKKNLDNKFKNIDTEIIDIFRSAQKYYNAFSRFAYIWKHKKSTIQIDHDLYMTPLDRNNRNVFSLLQQGKIYLFTASNLVSSINASLMNAPNFFVEPLVLKNPYTNVPFSKSSLYNIYFFLKQSPILMPTLFHHYFLADFNLRVFRDENENMIRNMYIKSSIRNSTPDILYPNIIRMLHKYQPKIIIDKDFPKDILANVMIPYLELYYIIRYSTEEYRVNNAKLKLLYKLNRLYKYNQAFGRKIIKVKREGLSTKMNKTITYNDNYISFDEIVDNKVYQESHIELIEENYTIENDIDDSEGHTQEDDTESTSDEIIHTQYVIISANPPFHIAENLFSIIANASAEYTESENTNEIDDDDDDDSDNHEQPDEVVIEDSSQNDENESDDENESHGYDDI